MSIPEILAHACVVFAGVIIGAVVAKFIDYKMFEQDNLYHFYVTFICVNSKGKRVYKSTKVSLRHLNPTQEEIENLCKSILDTYPEYKDCAIMSWIKLGVIKSEETKEVPVVEVASEESQPSETENEEI